MSDRRGVRHGQTVYGSQGKKLGRVLQCEDAGFFIEKGVVFPEDYWVEYEEVASSEGDAVRLRCPAAALSPETATDDWDPPRDPSGTAWGTDLEPLRAGMAELDEKERRARAAEGLPSRGAHAWREAVARQARAAEAARPPRADRRRVARPVATAGELQQHIEGEVEDFEREAANVRRYDLLEARAVEEGRARAAERAAEEAAAAPPEARAEEPRTPAAGRGGPLVATASRRLDFRKAAPEAYAAMSALERHVVRSGLERPLLELVRLRASQLNGCAYCVDMHSQDARRAGESEQRLYALPVWRDTPFFTARERGALAWTEVVTRLGAEGVPDESYRLAREWFEEKELVNLTLAIIAINGWNRLAIAFRSEPGSYRPPTSTLSAGERSG